MHAFPESYHPSPAEIDPYSDWSDDERISHYASTGDSRYLTLDLARRMQVSLESMREIPEATPADIREAQDRHETGKAALDAKIDNLLKPFGADFATLESTDLHGQFRALLDVATLRVSNSRSEEGFDIETIRDEAVTRLIDTVLRNEEGFYRLFEVIQLDSPKCFREISVIEQVVDYIKSASENQDSQASAALIEFMDIADRVLADEFIPQANYLGSLRLAELLRTESGREAIKPDRDRYIPFEITKGIYAVFSSDRDKIYVADQKMSKEIEAALRAGVKYVDDIPNNADSFPTSIIVPDDVIDYVDVVIDAGTPLDAFSFKSTPQDPDILTSYVTVLRSSLRDIIESKFGFSLTSLNIEEQVHFLNYLQHSTIESVDGMSNFIKTYGVEGMRSFLALAQTSTITGDHLVAFGASNEPDQVKKIFGAYCDLLDQKADIDSFLKTEFSGDEATIKEIEAVADEKLHKEAARFLVGAITNPNVLDESQVSELLATVEKAAGLAMAVSVALRSRKIKSVNAFQSFRQDIMTGAQVLEGSLFDEILAIYAQNYTEKYDYSDEGRAALLKSFTETLHKESTKVYVWRIGESDVLTFLYADEYPENQMVYIGGLNSNPAFKDTRAGTGLIEQMLRNYDAKGYTITAEAAPLNAMAYMKLYGFVATAITSDPDEDFVLAVARQTDWHFPTKDYTDKDFLTMVGDQAVVESTDPHCVILQLSDGGMELEDYFNNDFVMTRMIQQGGITYAVLEKAPQVQAGVTATGLET